jgi:signal transduction histidine kinase
MANRAGVSCTSLAARASGIVGSAAAIVSGGVVLVTLGGSIPEYQASPLERSLPAWLITLAVLGSLAMAFAAWVSSTERPAAAVGLAAATVGLVVPTWAGWATLSSEGQAYALAIAPIAVAGVAHVGLRWSRAARHVSALFTIYALAGAAVFVHAVAYNPLTDPGCALTCADIQPLAGGLLSGRAAYGLTAALVGGASVVAGVALIREGVRRGSSVVAWVALVAVATLALPRITHAIEWADSSSRAAALLPAVLAGLLIGFAPIVATAATRRMRSEVRDLVEHLSVAGLAGGARGGAALGVQFAVPDDGRWVDPFGVPVWPVGEPAGAVVVSDAAGPALRLEVTRGADPADVLASLTPATMLALQNARLAAVSRARLADVRASQRRIVDASDAERQRIERDLHDGAQQRLVSASFQLSLARTRLVEGGEALSRAEERVREALARLRQLGHGIFPATLASEGLAAALEDLVRTSDVPARLAVPELELDRDVAAALYAVVATALARARQPAGASSADVAVTRTGDNVEVRVLLIDSPLLDHDDLVDVADRIGAVGGQLAVEPFDGGVQITAVVPCA